MSYDGRFINAKNFKSKPYRNKNTGDLIEYCSHCYVIYPRFGSDNDYHADFIPLEKSTFEGFNGVCKECGEVIHIYPENVVKNEEEQERILEESLKANLKGKK